MIPAMRPRSAVFKKDQDFFALVYYNGMKDIQSILV